jgi:hypothetical protein
MKYVVVKPAGDLSKIFIMTEGAMITGPFESWALLDGKQVLFATTKMHKVLQSHHFAGSYEQGAMYAYTFTELCAIMSAHLGPSDRERYEALEADLKEESNRTLIKGIPVDDGIPKWTRIAYFLWKTLVFITIAFIKALNTILFVVLLPLIIKFFEGFRK